MSHLLSLEPVVDEIKPKPAASPAQSSTAKNILYVYIGCECDKHHVRAIFADSAG